MGLLDSVSLMTDSGVVSAVSPIIISASRATDLPAHWADWFIRRLDAGYVKWVNPFNQKSQYVSFEKTRVFVFWSKNPAPMLTHLKKIDDMGYNCYFTFTVNDYEFTLPDGDGWKLEPNLPRLAERIETFQMLSERLGKEKVIWRFDPLILMDGLGVDGLLERVQQVGNQLHQHTEKLVFSFADISSYRKVQRNLKAAQVRYREWDEAGMVGMAQRIRDLCKGWGIQAATCAESIDLKTEGIIHNSCVDGELMARLFSKDTALMRFLGYGPVQADMFGALPAIDTSGMNARLKDRGQRDLCGCIKSKDIGQYNTCEHYCVYCYANTSRAVVERNLERRKWNSESMISDSNEE